MIACGSALLRGPLHQYAEQTGEENKESNQVGYSMFIYNYMYAVYIVHA